MPVNRCLALGFLLSFASQASAASFVVGPISLPARLGANALHASALIKLDAVYTASTAKVRGRVSLKLPTSEVKALIEARIMESGRVDFCAISVQHVGDIHLSNVAHTAIVHAALTLSDHCPGGPTSAVVDVAVAPKVEKGGVLRANVGDVSIRLNGFFGRFLGDQAAEVLRDRLQTALAKIAWTPPKTDYGSFALQGARVEQIDLETAEATIFADGILTSEQATRLVARLLPSEQIQPAQ